MKILTPQALILGDILEHAARGKGVVCHIDDLKGNDLVCTCSLRRGHPPLQRQVASQETVKFVEKVGR